MFGFSSGGTSIGGGFSANSFRNSPVSFGGNITQGNLSTGDTTQSGDVSSTGGTTSQTADIKVEIPGIPGADGKEAGKAEGAAGAAEGAAGAEKEAGGLEKALSGGIPKIPGFGLQELWGTFDPHHVISDSKMDWLRAQHNLQELRTITVKNTLQNSGTMKFTGDNTFDINNLVLNPGSQTYVDVSGPHARFNVKHLTDKTGGKGLHITGDRAKVNISQQDLQELRSITMRNLVNSGTMKFIGDNSFTIDSLTL